MKDFYHTKAWKIKRKRILRRDGYMSALSKRYGKRIVGETVHHILPRDIFPEYQMEDWNLITLSNQEHNRMHDRVTGDLTDEGMELLRRTVRAKGMNEDGILERISERSGTV